MAWFQNICTEVFLQWPSTKTAKMVLLGWMAARAKNRKKKLLKISPPQPVSWFQSNFTEVCLILPCTKIAKKVPLGWTKWPPELKIEKKTPMKQISFLASGLISKWFHRNVPLIPLYQNCQNDSALLNKMVTRANNRKTFKKPLKDRISRWTN